MQGQIPGVERVLPLLDRPEHKRALQRFHIDAVVGQPAAKASLAARGQAMGQQHPRLPGVKMRTFLSAAARPPSREEHQMALAADRAVLTQEAGELTLVPVTGMR